MTCTLCGENCWPPCWRTWAEVFEESEVNRLPRQLPHRLVPSTVSHPSDVYLEIAHLASRQLHAQCSRGTGSEASPSRLSLEGR